MVPQQKLCAIGDADVADKVGIGTVRVICIADEIVAPVKPRQGVCAIPLFLRIPRWNGPHRLGDAGSEMWCHTSVPSAAIRVLPRR